MKIAILLAFLLFSIFICCDSTTKRPNTKDYVQLEKEKSPKKSDTQTEATAYGIASQSPKKDKAEREKQLKKIVKQGNEKGKSSSKK
uniref:Uncharacterized protein n=1 Tax=Meloidogyne enterolobii TaxID=390850 RepID=A0A6V7WLB6_MELEN|nr:unnamed protein product [Meloidogyne enterolobii]